MKKTIICLLLILSLSLLSFAADVNKTAIKSTTIDKNSQDILTGKSQQKFFLINNENKETIPSNKNKLDFKSGLDIPTGFQSTYRVRKGDTLGGISIRFGVGQGEIKRLNQDFNFDTLEVGKELIMPISQDKIDSILAYEKSNEQSIKEDKFIFSSSGKNTLRVKASAYTSHVNQTSSNPFLAAWGDRLSPGMKVVAVSRDLISQYGITNGTKIKISGLDGYYIVKDKMNKRYTKHIDIYMGLDKARALRWGRRSVTIYW